MAAALGAFGATAVFAQTASTPAATDTTTTTTGTQAPGDTGGWHKHRHHDSVLTEAERAELKKDRDTVFASNLTLKTQEQSLREQFKTLKSQTPPATKAQFEALKQQHEALQTQVRTAIEGVDSGAAALFQKLDAAKSEHHHGQ